MVRKKINRWTPSWPALMAFMAAGVLLFGMGSGFGVITERLNLWPIAEIRLSPAIWTNGQIALTGTVTKLDRPGDCQPRWTEYHLTIDGRESIYFRQARSNIPEGETRTFGPVWLPAAAEPEHTEIIVSSACWGDFIAALGFLTRSVIYKGAPMIGNISPKRN